MAAESIQSSFKVLKQNIFVPFRKGITSWSFSSCVGFFSDQHTQKKQKQKNERKSRTIEL